MTVILNIIITLIVFNVLVVVHEWGHYKTARLNGILVEEFAIGMGPILFSKKKGDTLYSIRALPIGGFCRMLGEENNVDDTRAFNKKSTWARMAVIAMGPIMNFVLCFVIVFFLISTAFSITIPKVTGFVEDTNAQSAGLEIGDTIKKINGEGINTYDDLYLVMDGCDGEDLSVTVLRDNKKIDLTIKPTLYKDNSRWIIGFRPLNRTGIFAPSQEGYASATISETLHEAVFTMVYYVKSVIVGFVRLFTFNISPDEVSGPIGIVQVVGETVENSMQISFMSVIKSILGIMAILSVNLGVINLFPIPAMDGGHLVFLIIETIRGKALDRNKEALIHFIGFVLLMIFMLAVASNDVFKLIK